MFPSVPIEKEFSNFIELGGMMTKPLRKELVGLLYQHFYDPGFEGRITLQESEIAASFPNWSELILKLMEEKDLKELSFHNEDFSISVTKEAISWMRATHRKFKREYQFKEESQQVEQFHEQLEQSDAKPWLGLIPELKKAYPQYEQSWDFYLRQIQSQAGTDSSSQAEKGLAGSHSDRMKVIYQKVVSDWERFMEDKRAEKEAGFLLGEFSTYHRDLKEKIETLNLAGDVVSPFYNFLGEVWTNSLDNWENIRWGQLEETAKSLQSDPNLQQLADLLGRMHTSQMEKVWEKMEETVSQPEFKPNATGKSEIVGIHSSDRISALLPSEIALLSTPETEVIFSKKYVEKKLLTFQYRSWDKIAGTPKKEEKEIQTYKDDKGPIILIIDTSGSMYGDPERIAKALAFGILEIALKDKRKAYIISFSSGIATIEVTHIGKDLTRMIDFLQMSFHGSTNLQPALAQALKLLDTEAYEKADVLVISDFALPHMGKIISDQVTSHRLNHGTHFHSLHIRSRTDLRTSSLPFFDHHWVYDLSDPKILRQTIDHFEELRKKNEKNDKLH